MSQNPGGWPPQGGFPPGGQGQPPGGNPAGYPPAPPAGQPTSPQPPYNPQGPYTPQGPYNPQGPYPQGYPQGYGPQGGYPPQPGPGGYGPQGPGGYGPQGPGGYGPQGPGGPPGGYLPGGGQPKKKSTGLIIGIVAAAVVLLVAVGGVIMALTGGGDDQPSSTITPGDPTPPPDQPTEAPSSAPPSSEPPSSAPPSSEPPSSKPPSSQAPNPPNSGSISLGSGVSLTPAAGWKVKSKTTNVAQLTNGDDIFLGQTAKLQSGSKATQVCDAWHKQVAKNLADAKYADPKSIDLKTSKLDAATCVMQGTVANGSDSVALSVFSLVSVRTDGLTVVGTAYFTKNSDVEQLDKDFNSMVNSMLRGQVSG